MPIIQPISVPPRPLLETPIVEGRKTRQPKPPKPVPVEQSNPYSFFQKLFAWMFGTFFTCVTALLLGRALVWLYAVLYK
jgi:hypothetical protein